MLAALGAARGAEAVPWLDRLRALAVDLPPGVEVLRDLAYGPAEAHKLDVYRPAGARGAPVVVFVHGGAWRIGDKAMPRMLRSKMPHWTGQGWLYVSINYRMLPEAGVLEQADDVGRALAHVQQHAAAWGADGGRVVLIGHSAGAHLAALLSADPAIGARLGVAPWLATVVLDTAALDMVAIMSRPHYRFYDPVFGTDPKLWRQASPTHRLHGAPVAPMLLICSSLRDDSCGQAQAFAAKARGFGAAVEVQQVALSHEAINQQLGADATLTGSVDAFLRRLGA